MPEIPMFLAGRIQVSWQILGNQSSLEIHWVSLLTVLALWEILIIPVLEAHNFLQFLKILNMMVKLQMDRYLHTSTVLQGSLNFPVARHRGQVQV